MRQFKNDKLFVESVDGYKAPGGGQVAVYEGGSDDFTDIYLSDGFDESEFPQHSNVTFTYGDKS